MYLGRTNSWQWENRHKPTHRHIRHQTGYIKGIPIMENHNPRLLNRSTSLKSAILMHETGPTITEPSTSQSLRQSPSSSMCRVTYQSYIQNFKLISHCMFSGEYAAFLGQCTPHECGVTKRALTLPVDLSFVDISRDGWAGDPYTEPMHLLEEYRLLTQ